MKAIKTSIKEVFNDDPNSPFWTRIRSRHDYAQFEKDIAQIMAEKVRKALDEVKQEYGEKL